MKKKKLTNVTLLTVFALMAGSLAGCGNTNNKAGAAPPVTELTATVNTGVNLDYNIQSYDSVKRFSYEFFAQNTDSVNPALSPVSAYLALSMAGLGAEGATRTEFYNLLGEDMMAMSDHLMNTLPKSSENTVVSLANSAWIDNQFLVEDQWLGSIKSLLDAEAFQTDLQAEVMDSMNQWIEERTNGMIKAMVDKPFSEDTRLVLFDTIYFKAKWSSPFMAYLNVEDTFTLENKESVTVEMMRDSFLQDYLSNAFVEGVVLPYRSWGEEDGRYAFVALKSKVSGQNIREIAGKLTSEVITDLLANAQIRQVNLRLPKFEITFDKELNQSLKNMGLTQAFDAALADLSLMGTTKSGQNLFISLVRQKAKIIVDEEGTEAAAATEVVADAGAMLPENPVDLYFNEPFIYIIMDMDKEIPLFIGILDNPLAE